MVLEKKEEAKEGHDDSELPIEFGEKLEIIVPCHRRATETGDELGVVEEPAPSEGDP